MSWQDELGAGFNQALGEGREDWRRSFFEGRALDPLMDAKGKRVPGQYKDMTDAPRGETTLGTNPTIQRAMENVGIYDKNQKIARDRMGLGLQKTTAGRVGQMAGTLVNDVLNDNTRAIWWLINAPQAVVNIANEELLNALNPDLFGSETITQTMPDGSVRPYPRVQVEDAGEVDLDDYLSGSPDLGSGKGAAQKEVNYQRDLEYKDP